MKNEIFLNEWLVDKLKRIGEPQSLLFMLPALIPLTIFWLAPMVYVFYLSFTEWDFMSPVKEIVFLENYSSILQDPAFYQTLKVTLLFSLGSVIPVLVGGLLLALLLDHKIRGTSIYRLLIFMPWVTPTVAISIVWSWIFEPKVGLANSLLSFLGIKGITWLQDSKWALVSILIVTIWKLLGWAMVFYLVALQNVPQGMKEAAELDGANKTQRFFNITVPMISPTTFFLFIVMLIESLQAYDQINVLTQGGPSGSTRTLLYMYYLAAFDQFNVGYASAIVTVLVVICIFLSLSSLLISRKMVHHS